MQAGQEQVHSTTTVPPDLGNEVAREHDRNLRKPRFWKPEPDDEIPPVKRTTFWVGSQSYNMTEHKDKHSPGWSMTACLYTSIPDCLPSDAEIYLLESMRDRMALNIAEIDAVLKELQA